MNLIDEKLDSERRSLHDHVCNEQTNEEILLVSRICRELKEKRIENKEI